MARITAQRLCECSIRHWVEELYLEIIIADATAVKSYKYRLSLKFLMYLLTYESTLCEWCHHSCNFLNIMLLTIDVQRLFVCYCLYTLL